MIPKLTDELREAIEAGNGEAQVEDEQTQKVYVITDLDTHREAMEALRRQQDCEAIARGIEDMEAGRATPVDQVHSDLREELNSQYDT